MAKYTNSPFGTLKGAQMGLVASRWKGVNYVRQHVVPANPQTELQTAQRNKMKNVTEWGRRIVDTVLNQYTIPLPKKMSAFNDFVSRNVKLQTSGVMDYSLLKVVQGVLYNPGLGSLSASVNDYDINFSWTEAIHGEAQLTDIAVQLVYNKNQDKFYLQATGTRDNGGSPYPLHETSLAEDDVLHAWLFFVAADGTLVSDSSYKTCVVTG
jgi:hypothetical protein